LCEKELAAFLKKYFPGFDLGGSEFRRLQQVCRDLWAEAAQVIQGRPAGGAIGWDPGPEGPLVESLSPAWRDLLETAGKAAWSKAPVLLCGETGTGKEVLARFIHRRSPRADGPLVAFNCGAVPENLLESELFGYHKGAFTGADRDKPGLAEKADQGTLFLDEIGEMPRPLQVKLLRFLQEGGFVPLGGDQPVRVDARVVAATNKDLEKALAEGSFRLDLYYRLNVFCFHLPPLRERKEDIPALAGHFLTRYNLENHALVRGLKDEALAALDRYDWPGNVRELENVIHRAVVLAGAGRLGVEHLPPRLADDRAGPVPPASRPGLDREALRAALAEALAGP
ncbi:MAG: sigma 54-interacting transcriptional regulator, partial [Thermodesulfobacteriota bacterium]